MKTTKMFLFTGVMLLGLLLSSCQKDKEGSISETPNDTVNLIYYTIGTPDIDLDLVNNKLNELLLEKINLTISYNKIPWDEYDNKITSLINSGQPFDIAFAVNYATNAQRKAWLPLDDYLLTIGKDMYEAVHPTFWEGVKIDNMIFGVPTNKELAVLAHWMFPKEIIQKYNINLDDYTSLESLEPLFQMIKKNEPDYLIMELDKLSHNFFVFYGYEYVTERSLPLMVKSFAEQPVVENVFETEDARHLLNILRKYYVEGFINSDASTYHSANFEKGRKVFFKQADGGLFSDSIWSNQRGYDIISKTIIDTPLVTTESARGGIMSVSANTTHPEESVKFLNCLNTDPDVRNLINFGIEGIHYDLSDKGQVIKSDEDRYSAAQYTQGNWFILKTIGGSVAEPIDKWDKYREFNDSAKPTNIFGFTPDLKNHLNILQRIEKVQNKYYPSLMTGSIDVDIFLPKYVEELKAAGIDEVKAELQRQLDIWMASKNKK